MNFKTRLASVVSLFTLVLFALASAGLAEHPAIERAETAVASRNVDVARDIAPLLDALKKSTDTGEKRELILQDNPGVLGDAEIRERLASLSALKVHPREDQANLAAIARIERLYEERLDQRQVLQDWLARFMAVVESQDRARIERERGELSQALDRLETQGFD